MDAHPGEFDLHGAGGSLVKGPVRTAYSSPPQPKERLRKETRPLLALIAHPLRSFLTLAQDHPGSSSTFDSSPSESLERPSDTRTAGITSFYSTASPQSIDAFSM